MFYILLYIILLSPLKGISPKSGMHQSTKKKSRFSIYQIILTCMFLTPTSKKTPTVSSGNVLNRTIVPTIQPERVTQRSLFSMNRGNNFSTINTMRNFSSMSRQKKALTTATTLIRPLSKIPRIGWPFLLAQGLSYVSRSFISPNCHQQGIGHLPLRQLSPQRFLRSMMTHSFDKLTPRNPQLIINRPLPSFSECYQWIDMKKAGEIVHLIQAKDPQTKKHAFVLWNTSKDRLAGYADVSKESRLFTWFQNKQRGENNKAGAHIELIYIHPEERQKGLGHFLTKNTIQSLLYEHHHPRVSLINAFLFLTDEYATLNIKHLRVGQKFYLNVGKDISNVRCASERYSYYPKEEILASKHTYSPIQTIKASCLKHKKSEQVEGFYQFIDTKDLSCVVPYLKGKDLLIEEVDFALWNTSTNRLAGYIVLDNKQSTFPHVARIQYIYILEQYQKKGLGKFLLRSSIERLLYRYQYKKVTLTSDIIYLNSNTPQKILKEMIKNSHFFNQSCQEVAQVKHLHGVDFTYSPKEVGLNSIVFPPIQGIHLRKQRPNMKSIQSILLSS